MATFPLTSAWQAIALENSGTVNRKVVAVQAYGPIQVMTGTSAPAATDLGIELDESHSKTLGINATTLWARAGNLSGTETAAVAVMTDFEPH